MLGSWIGVLLGLPLVGILAGLAVWEESELQMGLKGYNLYGSGEISSHPSCLVKGCHDRPVLTLITFNLLGHSSLAAIYERLQFMFFTYCKNSEG